MGRGVSAGGGQSSLGYLFGSGETTNSPQQAQNKGPDSNNAPPQKPAAPSQPVVNSNHSAVGVDDGSKQRPVAVHDSKTNNYLRTEGQNCGNFITDRPSTKVHAAPGGGSSLGYLFGGDGK